MAVKYNKHRVPLFFLQTASGEGADFEYSEPEEGMMTSLEEAEQKAVKLLEAFPVVRLLKEEVIYYRKDS